MGRQRGVSQREETACCETLGQGQHRGVFGEPRKACVAGAQSWKEDKRCCEGSRGLSAGRCCLVTVIFCIMKAVGPGSQLQHGSCAFRTT